jgi:uncharacterized protein YaeQ
MALKATIHRANLQIADMDRNLYADHGVTIARHPSETEERMMMRLLAFALCVPPSDDAGALEFAKSLWDPEEPDLWQKNLTGEIVQWIEVGQPDDRRLMKASGRAERVVVFSYSTSTPIWWSAIASKLTRARALTVWQVEPQQSQALAALAERSMQLQVTVQDGGVWMGNGVQSVEITPRRRHPA